MEPLRTARGDAGAPPQAPDGNAWTGEPDTYTKSHPGEAPPPALGQEALGGETVAGGMDALPPAAAPDAGLGGFAPGARDSQHAEPGTPAPAPGADGADMPAAENAALGTPAPAPGADGTGIPDAEHAEVGASSPAYGPDGPGTLDLEHADSGAPAPALGPDAMDEPPVGGHAEPFPPQAAPDAGFGDSAP